jgi:WD40 repeat protein
LLCLAVSPDGKQAAFAGGDRRGGETIICLWGLANRKPLGPPLAPAHAGLITALAFEPDGKHLLSGATDGLLLRTGLAGRRTVQSFRHPDPERGRLGVNGLAVSPDGKRALRAGGDGSLILLDLPALTVRHTIDEAHRDGVNAVAFLPDGKGFASAGKDGVVRVWDGATFTATDFKGHDGSVLSLSVRGDRLLSGGADGTLRLWGLPRGKLLQTLSGHQGAVNGVALSADGLQAISGGPDHTVRLWQLPR